MENFEEVGKQIIEDVIGESPAAWKEKLPADIKPEMVDLFLGNDNLWRWHLKPEYIKDEKEREKYKIEKENWS